MLRIILPKLIRSLVVIVGASTIVFFVLRAAPGDPALLLLGSNSTDAEMAAARHQLGLDAGIPTQLWRFLLGLAQGDLGVSLLYQQPVLELVMRALPKTALLGLSAFLLSMAVALPLGILSAARPGGILDRVAGAISSFAQSLPTFWIGIMLIDVFAVTLGWMPTSGDAGPSSLVLPSVTLALYQAPMMLGISRAALLDVLSENFVRTARAKGVGPARIVLRHALRNAVTPVVTVLALQLGAILSGAVITEAVFAWPGLGTLAMSAIMARDYPLIQGVVVLSAALVVALNITADALVSVLDPRVRR